MRERVAPKARGEGFFSRYRSNPSPGALTRAALSLHQGVNARLRRAMGSRIFEPAARPAPLWNRSRVATFLCMSRAFVKESDGAEALELPDRPISEHPNLVTPQGLAQIEDDVDAPA